MRAYQWLATVSAGLWLSIFTAWGVASAETVLSTQGSLSSGDAVLDDGSLYDQYTFAGNSGQQVTISLESQDFDPYLILLDPQGRRISENDDISRNNRNSQLVVVLPSTGTYTVVANSYEAGKSGNYEIKVEVGNSSTLTPQAMAAVAVPGSAPVCDGAILSAIGDIESDREATVAVSGFALDERYAQVPSPRVHGIQISLSGPASLSILFSPQFLGYISGELMQDCSSVGAVSYEAVESGFERVFGYLPSRVTSGTTSSAETPLPVGEFVCTDSPGQSSSSGVGDSGEFMDQAAQPNSPSSDLSPLTPWGQRICL